MQIGLLMNLRQQNKIPHAKKNTIFKVRETVQS